MGDAMLRLLISALLVTAAAWHAEGQEPTAPPVFKATADLVVLHVNVFDGKSDAVPDLPQSAFVVTEDGRPQPITFFSDADVPVAAGLVFDNSTSMVSRRKLVMAGSHAFVTSSHPEDELFTVIFNEHVRLGLQDAVPFTRSQAQVQASLLRFPAGGQTALHDAVIEALDHLLLARLQKRVLIVLSDGDDNASRHSEADMLHRASRSDALIYTISTADYAHQYGKASVLKKLAQRTGGVSYFPKSEAQIVEDFTEVARNIRRGYSIGYVPDNPRHEGEYRSVKVTVHVPGRNLSVRAREGYTEGGNAESR
jgi:Ca-activated chloride channel family protein